MPKCCSIEGCTRIHYARGVCKPHYRKLPAQQAKAREYEQTKRTTATRLEQERQRNQRRRSYINAWAEAHKDWATWWERQRYYEDRRELRHWKPRVWPQCRLTDRPEQRLFIAHRCQADGCGAMWLSYAAMPDAPYCKPCNRARWRETHYARAERYGARFEVIDPTTIFIRDGWRCQLCGCRTVKTHPHPRQATLDHIIPLSRGGDHVPHNLQCACWTCNVRKGARAANDQLLLEV